MTPIMAPGVDALWVPGSPVYQLDPMTLQPQLVYTFHGVYYPVPLTTTTGVAFSALGSILNPAGMELQALTLGPHPSSAPVAKLNTPNASTIYQVWPVSDTTALLAYSTVFMGDPDTLGLVDVSKGRVVSTVDFGAGAPPSVGHTAVDLAAQKAWMWSHSASEVVVVDLAAMKVSASVPTPAKWPASHPFSFPAISDGVLAYLSEDANNATVLVQVPMRPGAAVTSVTHMPTPPKSDNSLYWNDPVPVTGGFVVPYNMWNGTLYHAVPLGASAVSDVAVLGAMNDPDTPPVSFGSDVYAMVERAFNTTTSCGDASFFLARLHVE